MLQGLLGSIEWRQISGMALYATSGPLNIITCIAMERMPLKRVEYLFTLPAASCCATGSSQKRARGFFWDELLVKVLIFYFLMFPFFKTDKNVPNNLLFGYKKSEILYPDI